MTRLDEVTEVVAATRAWAGRTPAVTAVLVVGSYAYGRPRADSDLDLVLVTSDPAALSADDAWVAAVLGAGATVRREQDWGPLRERRFRRSTGLDVELGIAPVSWLDVPVDAGTARVLRDGCAVVLDRDRRAAGALLSLEVPLRTWGLDDVWSRPARPLDPPPTPSPLEEDRMFDPDLGALGGSYELDRAHTRIGFVARQLAGAPVRGSFHTFAGGGRFRPADPASATAEVSIDAATVDTGNDRRDRHLVSAAFLDVEQHPRITFRSTAVEPVDGARARLTGDLTVRGRTEPVTVEVTCTESVAEPGGHTRARFEGVATVSRRAWGLGWGGPLVRDAVTLELDLAVVVTRARALTPRPWTEE